MVVDLSIKKRGASLLVVMIAVVLLIGVLFNLPRFIRLFKGYEPKYLKVVQADDIKSARVPTVVYFYHKLTDSTPRRYLPILDEYSVRYGDRLNFYRYRFADEHQETYKDYWRYESKLVVFENGQEVAAMPGILSDQEMMVRGFVFKLLKPWIVSARSLTLASRSDWFVTSRDFRGKVLESVQPVVVDFTCQTCPAARMLEPDFKKIALQNADLANFFLVDIDAPENRDLIRQYRITARPTVLLFNQGRESRRFSGASPQLIGNEAQVLGLLSYN